MGEAKIKAALLAKRRLATGRPELLPDDYADLRRVLKNDGPLKILWPGSGEPPVGKYIDLVSQMDGDVPSYDFGHDTDVMLDDIEPDGAQKILSEACAAMNTGTLRLPYEECAFISRVGGTIAIYFAYQTQTGEIGAIAYVKHHDDWFLIPLFIIIETTSGNIKCYNEDSDSFGSEAVKIIESIGHSVLTFAQLLHRRGVEIKEASGAYREPGERDDSDPAYRNRRRIIHINKTVYLSDPDIAPGVVAGHVKAPHERAGHWRTYKKSARMVWIDKMKINGGSNGTTHYRVVP